MGFETARSLLPYWMTHWQAPPTCSSTPTFARKTRFILRCCSPLRIRYWPPTAFTSIKLAGALQVVSSSSAGSTGVGLWRWHGGHAQSGSKFRTCNPDSDICGSSSSHSMSEKCSAAPQWRTRSAYQPPHLDLRVHRSSEARSGGAGFREH